MVQVFLVQINRKSNSMFEIGELSRVACAKAGVGVTRGNLLLLHIDVRMCNGILYYWISIQVNGIFKSLIFVTTHG